jgi:hypothetical protein
MRSCSVRSHIVVVWDGKRGEEGGMTVDGQVDDVGPPMSHRDRRSHVITTSTPRSCAMHVVLAIYLFTKYLWPFGCF